jgi:hypothetical protein
VGRAFAAATGLFVPIWIVKQLRAGSKPKRAQTDESYAKIEALLTHEHALSSQYVPREPVRQSMPVVSPLSSRSERGTYERLAVERRDHDAEEEADRAAIPDGMPAGTLQRSASISLQRANSVVSAMTFHPDYDGLGRDGFEPPPAYTSTGGLMRSDSVVSALSEHTGRRV